MTSIKKVEGSYPKIRDLQKLLKPKLDLFKINTILKYLERAKRLETDLDGNIIWIREDISNSTDKLSLAERADLSKEFLDFFSKKNNQRSEEEEEETRDGMSETIRDEYHT